MPIINWTSEFSVNVKMLDAQHKVLIDITNQLYDAMREGKGNKEIEQILQRLIEYSNKHFTEEEQLLVSNHYPRLTYQKTDHQAFIKKIRDFTKEAQEKKLTLSLDVSQYLKDWWVKHILQEDKQYGAFLNSKGVF